MKKPFFSIVIPTYNRPLDLKMAISSVLRQDFRDSEIVVSDNSQNTKSEKICQKLQDKRIKYFRNKTNIGFYKNLYVAIKRASGNYIFILGDDDLILKVQTLSNVYKLISKYHYGYIRLKYVYYKNFNYIFSHFNTNRTERDEIKKNQPNADVYQFIYDAVFQFISGNIFKNMGVIIPELASGEKKPLIEESQINFLYAACKNYGGYVDKNNVILAKWSTVIGGTYFFDVIDNRIFLEKSWDLIFPNLTKSEQQRLIIKQTNDMVWFLPSLKYYTNNTNVIRHIKRTFELNRNLIYNPKYYISAFVALTMPRFVWDILRKVFQSKKRIPTFEFQKELNDLEKYINQ